MTYNTLSYIIYAPIAIYITVVVGYQCYKNGLVYVLSVFKDKKVSESINKILLVGYYLTNIGYAIMIIKRWEKIENIIKMINVLSENLASIVMILALLHYLNVITLSMCRQVSIKNFPLERGRGV